MSSVVLFGSGSPLIVDVEETCRRCGLTIAAVVKNVDGDDHTLHPQRLVRVADAPPELFGLPIILPLFTPAHRRLALSEAAARGGRRFEPLVDPTAILPASLTLGEGVYVNAGVTIGGASELGRFSLVNRGASLGHHARLAEFASLGPSVVTGGGVAIGRGAVIGTGAVILPGVAVGDNAIVAAGSVLTRDLPANVLAAGNPARIVKESIAGYGAQGI